MARILVAAAGTGGHVYPGLAVAGVLRDRGHEVHFAGGDRLEASLVPEAGFELHRLPGRGLPRSVSPGAVLAGIDLLRAVAGARRLVRRLGIDAAVGMGGYHSVAPCVAVGWRKRPVVLHEQNGHLALAHRLTLRWARVLALSVPLAPAPRRPGLRVETTGNPLRPSVRALAESSPEVRRERRQRALERFGLAQQRTTVVVTGGSLGAQPVNEAILNAAVRWTGRDDVQVIHITGSEHLASVRTSWMDIDVPHALFDYMADIEDAFVAADIVIARSGGMIHELTAFGIPSVLVPGPWSTGSHQEANARWLRDQGAALLVRQTDPGFHDSLAAAVTALLDDGDRRAQMASRARAIGRPDAADRLADLVESAL